MLQEFIGKGRVLDTKMYPSLRRFWLEKDWMMLITGMGMGLDWLQKSIHNKTVLAPKRVDDDNNWDRVKVAIGYKNPSVTRRFWLKKNWMMLIIGIEEGLRFATKIHQLWEGLGFKKSG